MSGPRKPRVATFEVEFIHDLRHWTGVDRRLALRVLDLVEAVLHDPFAGIGKPEPLRGNYAGLWSRRVNERDRLVYQVREGSVLFLSARSHYHDR